jgi:hypothetical protein
MAALYEMFAKTPRWVFLAVASLVCFVVAYVTAVRVAFRWQMRLTARERGDDDEAQGFPVKMRGPDGPTATAESPRRPVDRQRRD